MPWYEYACTACGKKVKRNRSLAYRDALSIHSEEERCGGRLERVVALPGHAEAIPPRGSRKPPSPHRAHCDDHE